MNEVSNTMEASTELDALLKEAEALKLKLEGERNKPDDVTLWSASERLEAVCLGNVKPRRVLKGAASKVLCCDWSPDRRRIVTSAQDGRACVWDAFSAVKELTLGTAGTWAMACAYAPCGTAVAVGGLDNKATVLSVASEGRRAVAHGSYVSGVAFAGSARRLASAGGEGGALWDVESGARLFAVGRGADALCVECMGAGGDVLAVGGADGSARLFDARAGRSAVALARHAGEVSALRFHPGGDALASACEDARVRVLELRAGRVLAEYHRATQLFGASSVEWSSSGRLLFAGYGDHTCAVWDALRGGRLAVLCGHEHRVSRVRLSPDGTALATASWDGTVRIWA